MELYVLADFHNQNANKMGKKRTNEECIKQEILRLEIVTAWLWSCYKDAIIDNLSAETKSILANEYCLNQHDKRCLQMRNFKKMTYNVKLLYDK